MIDTVLFDLDGTLLQMGQEEFLDAYMSRLGDVFARLGLEADAAVKATWAGTGAMVQNDGSKLNSERFWEVFSGLQGLAEADQHRVEAACDAFYTGEFDEIKSIVRNLGSQLPDRMVRSLADRGYTIALATNPLFPEPAVRTRLAWIGLAPSDFVLATHYANSTFCKPNLGYYREILSKIGKDARSCLMIGNSPKEDMCAGALGLETYLVTDCIEGAEGSDLTQWRHGTLVELGAYLAELPAL